MYSACAGNATTESNRCLDGTGMLDQLGFVSVYHLSVCPLLWCGCASTTPPQPCLHGILGLVGGTLYLILSTQFWPQQFGMHVLHPGLGASGVWNEAEVVV